MDFNILVNQRVAESWGLNLKQAFFFAYLYHLPSWSTKAKTLDGDENPYHWVTQKKIIDDLPLLGIKPESIRNHFKPLEERGLIKKHTVKSRFGSMMYIQVTEKAKVDWSRDWREDTHLQKNAPAHLQKFAGAHPQIFADNPSTNNHKTKDPLAVDVEKVKKKPDPIPYDAILEAYSKSLPNNPAIRKLPPKRKKAIKKLWEDDKKHQSVEWWERYFDYVSKQPFLTGHVTDFVANIDWLLKLDNFTKIIEGHYKQRA
jgi:DNA-binding MarR family transcriptional regulator